MGTTTNVAAAAAAAAEDCMGRARKARTMGDWVPPTPGWGAPACRGGMSAVDAGGANVPQLRSRAAKTTVGDCHHHSHDETRVLSAAVVEDGY